MGKKREFRHVMERDGKKKGSDGNKGKGWEVMGKRGEGRDVSGWKRRCWKKGKKLVLNFDCLGIEREERECWESKGEKGSS